MKLLEMVKDVNIKYGVSSPQNYGRTFFLLKRIFMGEQFFGQIYGGLFYIGSNDQIMQRGRKSFTNAFFSNLNSVNLKFFPSHDGKHT